MYDVIAQPLQFFYGLWPNYAGAIALLTLSIMIVLLPLTLKGTRSMLAMQKLQPEMKKLQAKHRDDRQKLNEEMMKFYKENNVNPMSGCAPLFLQAPVFFFLYRTLYQLINRAPYGSDMGSAVSRAITRRSDGTFEQFGYFRPKHLDVGSRLYQDLSHTREMRSFGINLAESTQRAITHGFLTALPFVALVLAVTATSFYQQRQIAGRNPQAAQANPQQAMLMKIMPLFFALISFTLPAGVVVYFLVSNLFRIGQQGLITRTMYAEAPEVVATRGHEVDKTSIAGSGTTEKRKGFFEQLKESGLPSPQKAREDFRTAKASEAGGNGTKSGTIKARPVKSSGAKAIGEGVPARSRGSAGGNAKGATTSAVKSTRSIAKGVKETTPKAPAASTTAPARSASGPSRSAPTSANRSRNKKKRK